MIDDPGVDGAESDFVFLDGFLHCWDIFYQPFDFEEGEIGGDRESCPFFEVVSVCLGELIADMFGPGVAPDDGIVVGFARGVPADHCFPLVGDSQPLDLLDLEVGYHLLCFGDGGLDSSFYIGDNLKRVVF